MFPYPPPPSDNDLFLSWNGFRVDSILFHSARPQDMLQIEWRQKDKIEYGMCDKKILTPPSIKICPLFDELKDGDLFYPPPP